jgi:glycosyltransferase involved in cell wall biosynthesis
MSGERISILYFSSFSHLRWGGQKSLFYLVTNLDMQKYRPFVIVPEEGELSEKLRRMGIGVIVIDLPRVSVSQVLTMIDVVIKLNHIIKTYRVKLIHTDGPRNTFYAGVAAKIMRIPLIFHVRALDRDPCDRLLYVLSTKIILVANSLRSRFDWASQDNKFITVYNGLDLSEFQISARTNIIRKEYNINQKCILLVCVARIEPIKGQRILIEAMKDAILQEKDIHLLIVGDIGDTAYFNTCSELADKSGLKNHITFAGHKENIPEILADSDILVLSSTAEAFPRSIIEAMAMGKPIIASDVGGLAEAVVKGISGLIVSPADPVALANAIIKLANDDNLRQHMGVAARKRAEQMFSIEQNVRSTEQVYEALLGN